MPGKVIAAFPAIQRLLGIVPRKIWFSHSRLVKLRRLYKESLSQLSMKTWLFLLLTVFAPWIAVADSSTAMLDLSGRFTPTVTFHQTYAERPLNDLTVVASGSCSIKVVA